MPCIIDGTDDSDELRGTAYDDVISGYGDDDFINGRGGDDTLYGDNGDDDLIGGTGINDFYGGRGYDIFIMIDRDSGFTDDLIYDFDFDFDQIDVSRWGASDFSQIKALLHTNSTDSATLNAYWGGRDHWLTIDGVFPGELLPIDFLYSLTGARDQYGTQSGDVLFGSRGGETLYGLGGGDILLGGKGNDTLLGDTGGDDLHGGAGRDILRGGGGYDALVYAAASESPAGSGRDRIAGFQLEADLIDVEAIDARSGASGNQTFQWRGTAALTGPGQLNYRFSGGNTLVSGTINADPAAEFQYLLTGKFHLTADDFVL